MLITTARRKPPTGKLISDVTLTTVVQKTAELHEPVLLPSSSAASVESVKVSYTKSLLPDTPDWPPEVVEAAALVLNLSLVDLPPAPFDLHAGVTVVNAEKFLRSIKADAILGPKSPRAVYGALQEDLLRVCEITRSVHATA